MSGVAAFPIYWQMWASTFSIKLYFLLLDEACIAFSGPNLHPWLLRLHWRGQTSSKKNISQIHEKKARYFLISDSLLVFRYMHAWHPTVSFLQYVRPWGLNVWLMKWEWTLVTWLWLRAVPFSGTSIRVKPWATVYCSTFWQPLSVSVAQDRWIFLTIT